MFSKPKIPDPVEARGEERYAPPPQPAYAPPPAQPQGQPQGQPRVKTVPSSSISADITITGNITTTGDIQIDGIVEGDIRAHMLTVGENATISGEIVADDVVIHGLIRGRVRGVKIRLTSTARVEGDIIHKTIAIESGAQFEGSVKRRDDPLGDGKPAPAQKSLPRPAEAGEGSKPDEARTPEAARSGA